MGKTIGATSVIEGSCYYLQAMQATQVTLATVVSGSGAGDCGNYQLSLIHI